jgi:hypothetical protein
MEHVHIFYGHLKYLTAIWYILWTFGIFCGYFVFFSRFGMYQEKSGNTDPVVKVYYKGKPNLISDIYKCKTMQYKHCMPPPKDRTGRQYKPSYQTLMLQALGVLSKFTCSPGHIHDPA